MRSPFPVSAGAHSQGGAQTVGIFDAYGYWASIDGKGGFELKATVANTNRINRIVSMLNAAYEQGREHAQREIREALGIET